VDQQRQMLQSYAGFANVISSSARQKNATWPFFRIPDFELHGRQARLQSGSEFIGCTYVVYPDDEDEYLTFVTDNFEESIKEGLMTRYGNLDLLVPAGYIQNFTILGPEGFQPDTISRPYRSPGWQISPRTFHPLHYYVNRTHQH
jgi:hypothetical protein